MGKKNEQIIVTTATTARFFGVTGRQVQRWFKSGCPAEGRGRQDLMKVFAWWWENIAFERAQSEGKDESLAEARRLYWMAKAQREQYRADQERSELVPRAEIASSWAARLGEVRAGLMNLKHRLPGVLVGKDRDGIFQILDDEVYQILSNYQRPGLFCERPADEANGQEE